MERGGPVAPAPINSRRPAGNAARVASLAWNALRTNLISLFRQRAAGDW